MFFVPSAFSPHRFGQYTLTARLGRGGMADVYRARREGAAGFERTVVVKKILSSHNEDPQFVDMFINEAKIAARLTHPNIVQVYELGEQDGEFFIVMEYVKGKDLLRLLRTLAQTQAGGAGGAAARRRVHRARDGARPRRTRTSTPTRTARSKPIVHRDVSPQNIMLSYDGQVKLVDFGIAKALDTHAGGDAHRRAQGQVRVHGARAGRRTIRRGRSRTSSPPASCCTRC